MVKTFGNGRINRMPCSAVQCSALGCGALRLSVAAVHRMWVGDDDAMGLADYSLDVISQVFDVEHVLLN